MPDGKLLILAFCTGNIDRPQSGGELRVHHLYRELAARGHNVEVHALVARNHPVGFVPVSEGFSVTKRHYWGLDAALVLDRTGLVPITELPFFLGGLKEWLLQHFAQTPYDIVQFEFPWWSSLQGVMRDEDRAVVYSSHNLEWRWWRGRLARTMNGKGWRKRLYRREVEAAKNAEGTIATTAGDARWLKKHAARIAVVPNGFDARRIRAAGDDERMRIRRELGWQSDERVAVFVGSATRPNRQAAEFIAKDLAPRLASEKVRLVIAGKVGETLGSARENVSVPGVVEDVLPLYQAADVGLNPMTSGGGSNIKLVEMCAAGLPVVTTRFGLRGFEALGPLVRVAALEGFAGAMMEVERGDEDARETLLRPFSWGAGAERLEKFYSELLAK